MKIAPGRCGKVNARGEETWMTCNSARVTQHAEGRCSVTQIIGRMKFRHVCSMHTQWGKITRTRAARSKGERAGESRWHVQTAQIRVLDTRAAIASEVPQPAFIFIISNYKSLRSRKSSIACLSIPGHGSCTGHSSIQVQFCRFVQPQHFKFH